MIKTENMDDKAGTFGSLYNNAGDYLKTRVELIKLQAVDKTSDVTASVVSGVLTFLLVLFAVILFNIGLAVLIGELIGHLYLGFFIVTAFYILLIIIFHVFRKSLIKNPISTLLIKKMLN